MIVLSRPGFVVSTYLVERLFEVPHLIDRQIVEHAAGSGEDGDDLLRERQGRELRLLQQFHQALAAIELLLRGLVEIAAELRECRQFAVLREFEFQRSGHLPHGFDLRAAADAAYRKSDVHRGAHALVEQIGFEINLAVRDRNDVGRNVRGNVTGLRFDYRKRGQRSAAVFVAQLSQRAPTGASGDRKRLRDRLRGPVDGAAAARFRDTTPHAWKDRRRCKARGAPLSRKYSPMAQAA